MEWEAGRNFLMGQGIFYIISVIGSLGFLCISFQYILGSMLCSKAKKPGKKKTGYIGNLCETFEKQLKTRGNVNNVNNFVDNYLSTHKFGPISLISLDWFCGQLVYLCLLFGILSGGLGYIWKVENQQCLRIVVWGVGTFGSLFCIRKIANYGERMKKARLNLVSYLENDIMPGILDKKKTENKAGNTDKSGERMVQSLFSGENQGQASLPEYKQGEDSLPESRREQALEKKETEKKENIKARRTARLLEEAQNEKRRQESIEPVGTFGINKKDSGRDSKKGKNSRMGSQARLLVQMNEVRELAQKTMAEVDGESKDQKDTAVDIIQPDREEEGKESLRETAATVIRPLERESTRKTSKALTEKEEKIIANILKEYAKSSE